MFFGNMEVEKYFVEVHKGNLFDRQEMLAPQSMAAMQIQDLIQQAANAPAPLKVIVSRVDCVVDGVERFNTIEFRNNLWDID